MEPLAAVYDGATGVVGVELDAGEEHFCHRHEGIPGPRREPVFRFPPQDIVPVCVGVVDAGSRRRPPTQKEEQEMITPATTRSGVVRRGMQQGE